MMRNALPAIAIVAAVLISCAAKQPQPATQPYGSAPRQSPALKIADGVVTQLSSEHGNAYTSISPDQYEALGLEPGAWVHVAFADTAITLPVGQTYSDVPSGTPLAVLHREGLTFAVRDGNFSAAYGIGVGSQFCLSNVPDQQ